MKLSIIVPVYNVEAFLNKCVDSLLAQDLSKEDYEVILVDDGSTDSSGALCDTLAAEHGNIRVIHQQNRGLSGARNAGIPGASGTYVLFVDSDDFLCPNVLGTLVGLMESKELDILRFNYQNVNMDGAVFEPNKYVKPFVDYSDVVCDGETFLNERLGYACYAWQFLVKASILRKEGNGFKEGIYFEDVEWTPRILLQARRVASTDTLVYNYLFRTGSIARNKDAEKKRKAIRDKMTILEPRSPCPSSISSAVSSIRNGKNTSGRSSGRWLSRFRPITRRDLPDGRSCWPTCRLTWFAVYTIASNESRVFPGRPPTRRRGVSRLRHLPQADRGAVRFLRPLSERR